jgi:signal transduction histidine kinase
LRPLIGGVGDDESEREAMPQVIPDRDRGITTAGRRAPRRPSKLDPAPQAPVEAAAGAPLADALEALRDDLGFETASVFVPGPRGWQLLDRRGPERPWHAVLDPVVLEGTQEAAEYPDVRTVPGLGGRLADMGCASLACLPLPEGGRVLLDSGVPCRSHGWIERARPYLSLVSILTGPSWTSGSALRSHEEIATLNRLFAACQAAVAARSATPEQLLEHVREALGADEAFLVSERGADLDVMSSPGIWPKRLSKEVLKGAEPDGDLSLPEATLRELALSLGVGARAFAGAFGTSDPGSEMLLAGWDEGPALSPVSMSVAARAVTTARTALRARQQAVTSLMDRERARMAYALHDGLTQTVAGAVLELEALRKRIERDPTEAVAVIDTSKTEIRKALAELRGMLFDLSQPSDQDVTPAEPLTRYVEDVVRRWRLPARLAVEGDLSTVPPRTLSVAYVVIREALANAAKHASGTKVTVTLSASDEQLVVTVGDGGRGFTRSEEEVAREQHHVGLDMLRRRVAEVGGELRVESRQGKGTRIIASLPIEGRAS